MSTLVDSLIPTVDAGRQIAEDLGLRPAEWRMAVVTPAAIDHGADGLDRLRAGYTPDPPTVLEIEPTPRVRLSTRYQFDPEGTSQAGDIRVERISRSYTLAQLTGGADAFYVLGFTGTDDDDLPTYTGGEWTIVGAPVPEPFGWSMLLRKRHRSVG